MWKETNHFRIKNVRFDYEQSADTTSDRRPMGMSLTGVQSADVECKSEDCGHRWRASRGERGGQILHQGGDVHFWCPKCRNQEKVSVHYLIENEPSKPQV